MAVFMSRIDSHFKDCQDVKVRNTVVRVFCKLNLMPAWFHLEDYGVNYSRYFNRVEDYMPAHKHLQSLICRYRHTQTD